MFGRFLNIFLDFEYPSVLNVRVSECTEVGNMPGFEYVSGSGHVRILDISRF